MGGGNGLGAGASELAADGAGLRGDDGFDGTASGALRVCSGDSGLPLLRLGHSRPTPSSSTVAVSGEPEALISSSFSSLVESDESRLMVLVSSRLRCSSFKRSALRHFARRF